MATLNEAKTRKELIDPALQKAGWQLHDPNQVGLEIPVDGSDADAWKTLQANLKKLGWIEGTTPPAGISDYALYRPNGEIIAIVEAKKTIIDPRLAQAQAEFYVTQIAKRQSFMPFAFLTNGHDIYFWDVGQAPKRLVRGFFSLEDLENLLYLREHKKPLADLPINQKITDRAYQQEAIRRVCEAFDKGKRKTLLVMATGTGKTRTVMSLVDLMLQANQARRVLFVADRDALVKQALEEGFQPFIPSEPATRVFTHHIDTANRLYVVTLQTLSSCFERFTPAFFDLIIFDEVHRSIFNKWNDVLQYFDGRMVGLTATPSKMVDHNTLLEFDCTDGVPTFVYSYAEAVKEGYLVDYSLYKANTRFQRQGIRGVDLSEEARNALIEQGIDPDEIDYSGTDLEKTVTNVDTLRKQWEEIMEVAYRDASGQTIGKTIVFAMTQAHALRLQEVFEKMYPQFPNLVKVITYKSEYKGTLIDEFKKKDMPRIAISVDMLETGIDVPEVVNLVFMKPVHSAIRMQQMIGRGTRSHAACHFHDRLPDGRKSDFQVLDFWENTFDKSPEEERAQSLPVLVTIFNTRLKLLEQMLSSGAPEARQAVIGALRAQIATIPTDSYSVKKVWPDIAEAWDDDFWTYVTPAKLKLLRLRVGPLLRFVPDVDVEAASFTSKVERLKLQIVSGKDTSASAESIAEDASRLPPFVSDNPEYAPWIQLCLSPKLQTAKPAELDQVIAALAEQMKNRKKKPNDLLMLDLPDYIADHGYVLLQGGSEPVYVAEYRKQVEERVLALVDKNATLQAIGAGKSVTDTQLLELERTLRQELGGDLHVSEPNIHKVYAVKVQSLLEFLRYLLGLEGIPDYQAIVRRRFDEYIGAHTFTANQISFLRAVQSVVAHKRRFQETDFYTPPLSNFGMGAAERLFSPAELGNMLELTKTLSVIGH